VLDSGRSASSCEIDRGLTARTQAFSGFRPRGPALVDIVELEDGAGHDVPYEAGLIVGFF
jgi:hypothetical protein